MRIARQLCVMKVTEYQKQVKATKKSVVIRECARLLKEDSVEPKSVFFSMNFSDSI